MYNKSNSIFRTLVFQGRVKMFLPFILALNSSLNYIWKSYWHKVKIVEKPKNVIVIGYFRVKREHYTKNLGEHLWFWGIKVTNIVVPLPRKKLEKKTRTLFFIQLTFLPEWKFLQVRHWLGRNRPIVKTVSVYATGWQIP